MLDSYALPRSPPVGGLPSTANTPDAPPCWELLDRLVSTGRLGDAIKRCALLPYDSTITRRLTFLIQVRMIYRA